MYGSGQWRYSYQGHDIIEHGGNNPGFKTQVARFPTDNLGIVTLSNDGTGGGFIIEAVKFRIADELLDLDELDWNDRSAHDTSCPYEPWISNSWTVFVTQIRKKLEEVHKKITKNHTSPIASSATCRSIFRPLRKNVQPPDIWYPPALPRA